MVDDSRSEVVCFVRATESECLSVTRIFLMLGLFWIYV